MRYALAARPMAGPAVVARGRQAGVRAQVGQGALGQLDALPLREQFGKVGAVDARVARRRQAEDPLAQPLAGAVGGHPSGVAVAQGVGSPGPVCRTEAARLALRELQDGGRLGLAQHACGEVCQDLGALFDSATWVRSRSALHVAERDKAAGRWPLTADRGQNRWSSRHSQVCPLTPS